MTRLQAILDKKRKLLMAFQKRLSAIESISILPTDFNAAPACWFDIFTSRRKALRAFLLARGIETQLYYPCLHEQLPFLCEPRKFESAKLASDTGLWLPSLPDLGDDQ